MSNKQHIPFHMPKNVIQGRNANFGASMVQKSEPMDRPISFDELSPFSGYSTSSFDNNNLAVSQVINSVPQVSQQAIRQIIRQQIQLSSMKEGDSKNRNEINILKAQVRSLKQNFHNLNDIFKNSNVQKQIHDTVDKLLKDHDHQTAMNLRKVFKETRQQLDRDITALCRKQFTPLTFIDDVDIQLNEIQDKIALIQSKGITKGQTKNNNTVIAQVIEVKLNKMQRELDNVKKTINDNQLKLKQFDDENRIYKNIQEEYKHHIKFMQQKIKDIQNNVLEFNKKINNIDISQNSIKTDINFIKNRIQDINKQEQIINQINLLCKQNTDKIKIINSKQIQFQEKQNIFQNQSEKIKSNINFKQFIVSEENLNQSQIMQQQQQCKNIKNNNIQLQNKTSSPIKINEISYQIDIEGYLMDGNGKYLTDNKQQMIKLSCEQIQLLEKSQLIDNQ